MSAWARAVVLLLCAALAGACSNLVAIEATGVEVVLDPQLETSVLLAADGSTLADLHAEQDRDPVPLAAIPRVLRDAVIAVEDARFYDHAGVDARAVVRAVVANAAAGEVRQGGSTITQQLVKNVVVGDARTLDRKLTEASVAMQLEAQLSKDQILEHYLNTVYMGGGAYGAGAAARRWFGVEVTDLALHQAALLAGMLRAPARYDPDVHPDAARARRDLVVRLMHEQGLIEQEAASAAAALPLGVRPPPSDDAWRHPYAVQHALERLQHDPVFHVLGDTPAERARQLFGGGLVIETTIDPSAQRAAESAVAAVLPAPTDPRAALVALDPSTGALRALVGGRSWSDPDDPVARFNLATQGRRQPGSAFKPLVLVAALEAGWDLDDVLPAPASMTFPGVEGGEDWVVGNAGGADHGALSLRAATAWSANVVFAQLVEDVGAAAVVEVAERVGVQSDVDPVASIALGTQEVTVLDMATSTATLAAGGVRHDPVVITRITDRDGVAIWELPPERGRQVIDPAVAADVTLALRDVVGVGTGVGAALDRPSAGKTGTSQDNADAWYTGYTPDLAVAVWVGYPEGRIPMVPPRTQVAVQGGGAPAEIFARFGTAALRDVVATPFHGPGSDVVDVVVDLRADCLPTPYTPRDVIGTRGYAAGTEPTADCTEPAGPPTADVPPVVGMGIDQAVQALHAAGFAVVEQPRHAVDAVPGTVLAQAPAAGVGQVLPATGWVATVQVASADRTGTTVPDVGGLALDAARVLLESEGFAVDVQVGCPDDGSPCSGAGDAAGVVWRQAPGPGTRAPVHAAVTLWVHPA